MTTADLRYVDPASLSGEMQTRSILEQIGTPVPVIDWVLDTVRSRAEEYRALEKELAQVHLDMAQ